MILFFLSFIVAKQINGEKKNKIEVFNKKNNGEKWNGNDDRDEKEREERQKMKVNAKVNNVMVHPVFR